MKTITATVLALSIAAAAGAVHAQQPMTEQDVRTALADQGYTSVNDVEYEDGLWKADARSADGNRLEVRIHPATGKLYPSTAVATLTAEDVQARLDTAGYTGVHDVEFDDGLWTAEATDAEGHDVDLKLDPQTGEVIGGERD